jgi:hypothetical protein
MAPAWSESCSSTSTASKPGELPNVQQLENAIELATYFLQEREGDTPLAQQKVHVLDKISNALP